MKSESGFRVDFMRAMKAWIGHGAKDRLFMPFSESRCLSHLPKIGSDRVRPFIASKRKATGDCWWERIWLFRKPMKGQTIQIEKLVGLTKQERSRCNKRGIVAAGSTTRGGSILQRFCPNWVGESGSHQHYRMVVMPLEPVTLLPW